MILIVGGTGTLGRQVVPRLLERGEAVRVMTRRPADARALLGEGVEIVSGDLRDRESLCSAVRGCRTVVSSSHSLAGAWLASSSRVDDTGQRSLIAAAVDAGVEHLVFISARGASATHPVDFWRTKARIEQHLATSPIDHTIIRPSAFLDFHAYELVGKSVIAGGRTVVLGPGTSPRNFVAAADVADLVVRAVHDRALRGATIEIGGPENHSLLEVIAIFERVSGQTARPVKVPLPILRGMIALATPFHSGVRRILQLALLAETTDQTFDPGAFLERFPTPLTRLEDWARTGPGPYPASSSSSFPKHDVQPS